VASTLTRRVLTEARLALKETGVTPVKLGHSDSPDSKIRILSIPGVYKPWTDSVLLAEALRSENIGPDAAVLDMCTGSGVLSVAAALLGAGTVTAVDVSRRALLCTRLNALLHRTKVRTCRGDLFSALAEDSLFDVIVSNPPWLPSATDDLPVRSIARSWAAGRDGRALIDRVCAGAHDRLRPGGVLLLVQASFCDVPATIRMLTERGLNANVAVVAVSPMLAGFDERAWEVQREGPWARADPSYELVVVRASRPVPGELARVPGTASGASENTVG
jgi:release factor glutamine methyltransferase